MLRIILSLCFVVIFAFADSCDLSNNKQRDCELDVNNPPIFMHKFIDENNDVQVAYSACIYDGKITIYDEEYDIINCSLAEHNGMLTEGVIITNTPDSADENYKLVTNKNIELENNNILLRVAGDFIVDSGVRINTKNQKKFILEIIEGTNGKSSIILQRGAGIYSDMIIMPAGDKSTISLGTFFGGIYEKDFIDLINEKDASQRGDMETIINSNDIYSISQSGEEIFPYNGNVICGPDVDPLDLDNTQYILKRLYEVKDDVSDDTSKDSPNETNSICNVEEGNCFENILSYNNIKIYEKNYKIAAANINILPDYGVFIESGKIFSQNETDIKEVLPNANIIARNYGICGAPNKVAFSKELTDEHLTQDTTDAQEDDTIIAQDDTMDIDESIEDYETLGQDEIIDNDVEENIEDIIAEFNIENEGINNTVITQENITDNEIAHDSIANIIPTVDIDEDFLLVEQNVFNQSNNICNENLKCLYNELLPYDSIVWNKISSKNQTNSIIVLNLTNSNLDVQCEVVDYYNENLKFAYNLTANNKIGKIDLKFAQSSDKMPQIICKSNRTSKQTNKIRITPAKFELNPNFSSNDSTPTIKAGTNKIDFYNSKALTLEGDIDSGFNGELVAESNDILFKQNNICDTANEQISINPIKLDFTNGIIKNNSVEFNAKSITSGNLTINFNINDDDNNLCESSDNYSIKPKCIGATISKNIHIIPANFMIKTDIISDYKVSYYGQIDDRNSFKYNPILNIKLNAIDNNGEIIDINEQCNYGFVQLLLKSDKLIEFKRSASDRLNSKINIYLDEFKNNTADINIYFGISKVMDDYKAIRNINYKDVVEPQEITLTDLNFDATFKGNDKFYDYNNLIVYDRLGEDSNPQSVLIVRGKIIPNSIDSETQEGSSVILKYDVFCESCDSKLLSKYLEVEELEMDSPNWFINTKHPTDFYVNDDFIKTDLKINNSNKALEGRQKITFTSDNIGIFDVTIDQTNSKFAPYLYYNSDFKNIYIPNTFKVVISPKNIIQNLIQTYPETIDSKADEPNVENNKDEFNDKQNDENNEPKQKVIEPKNTKSIQLDIED